MRSARSRSPRPRPYRRARHMQRVSMAAALESLTDLQIAGEAGMGAGRVQRNNLHKKARLYRLRRRDPGQFDERVFAGP